MLRLKDLRINQVPFWYQEYLGEQEGVDEDGNLTGEPTKVYGKPVMAMARISPNTGMSENSPIGNNTDYDKSISTVVKLPINELTKLFIDVVPEINKDGYTDTEPDYYCVAPKNDLQQNVWAIKKIKASFDEN